MVPRFDGLVAVRTCCTRTALLTADSGTIIEKICEALARPQEAAAFAGHGAWY